MNKLSFKLHTNILTVPAYRQAGLRSTILTVLTVLTVLTSLPPSASAAFRDVPFSHANKDAIEFVQEKGIVNGYPDGTYQPERLINRSEFTKIVVSSRFSALEIDNCIATEGFYKQKMFTDVDNGTWFEKYICVAKKNKILGGYPDGTFRPVQTINFAEAAKIVTNSYGLSVDSGESWFSPFLDKLAALQAVPVSISMLEAEIDRAQKVVTRGEMASVIFGMKNQNDTVVSEDGTFSIKIPEVALPEGVDLSVIRIRKLSKEDAPVIEVNGAPMVFYSLEPDGLQFRQSVTFTVSTPTSKNTIPIVFLVSGDSFDMVPEPLLEIDSERQQANISGQLEHFSVLGIGDLPLFSLDTNEVGNQNIGDSFPRTANITKNTTPNTFINIINTTSVQIMDDWSIGSGLFQAIRGDITPSLVVDVPDFKLLNGPNFFSTTNYFSCQSPGEALSKYHFTLEFTYIRRYGLDTTINSASMVVNEVGKPFNCIP